MLFLSIDVPEPLRPDAVQCALLLLPEEHLEALQSLLIFLAEVRPTFCKKRQITTKFPPSPILPITLPFVG